MITQNELQEILKREIFPESKLRLDYTNKISSWMKRKEIIIIKGIRRSGKTHIMYQLIKELSQENIFYVNFDDFRFKDHLNVNLLESIIKLRDPTKKAYFFLDEIQVIDGFEKWLRTYYDREENIKFIIGGSNISLLSPEMGRVLTGRNITFIIRPLSYDEFKTFSSEPFETYLEYGGFPEVVLEKDITKKRELLQQYLADIIARDIIGKYTLDNPRQLTAIIHFLLSNPGVRISAHKLGSQLGIHKDTAQKYISYIKETFLIFEVPFFSYSAKTKYIGSRASKYYAIDNGFHTVSSIKKNRSALFENLVATCLYSKDLMYWLDEVEIDFIYDKKAMQVTATDKIPAREIEAFVKFQMKNKGFTHIIVSPTIEKKEANIEYIPIKKIISLS